ncbi:MAG: hypothetical protein HOQ09_10970, partial [Gemmatimonadaceae bacterium]|nr:hypothetical protein [Gemmatimonadaceae bacterium]
MQHRARNRRRLMVLALALAMPAAIRAQTSYYNLDGSRPLRVEDVLPTERHALDVELAPLRYEHYPSGTQRLRLEPKLSYGVLPLTELEVRVPVVTIFPPRAAGARRTIGAAGVAVGALHAF